MKIEDLLSPDLMIMDLKATTQEEAIKEMADLEVKQDVVNNEDEFIKSIWAREKESTTGIGDGIAMPHARNKYINRAAVLFAKSPKGIDYNSLDGQPVHLFFMITAPAGADNTHLQALAKLSSLLINPDVVSALKAATKPEEVIDIFKKAEAKKDAQDKADAEKRKVMSGISHMLPFVIGGGILMAISFIVENYMAGGAKNPAFIFLNSAGNLAFAFMVPVLAAYIAESIGDLPALMPGFVGGYMAAIVNGTNGLQVNVQAHAVSPAGFLGGIAAGFIAGYMMIGLKKLFAKLPKSVEGMKPMLIYPILGLLFIALIMFYIINPIFSSINFAITHFLNSMGTGNLVILTLILAGMMAIDMGGPFNKAAYVFASGAFANDPHSATAAVMMAAVMVGGMVPPFATAIGTTFFKNRYTKEERRAGVSNWILGFSFITEGAIPFAAADPGRVIPSCVIGSAVGGLLVGLWHIQVPAPHGGLWVSPLSNHILLYFVATIIGSIVAGLIMSFWKKPVSKYPDE